MNPKRAAMAGDLEATPKHAMLDGLQILRGIAAILVIIDHAMLAVIPFDHRFGSLLNFAGTIGKMGVNIFFVISGYIMMHTTRSTSDLEPSARIAAFSFKRITRLAPLYWLATVVMILLSALQGLKLSGEHILTSFTFLPNFEDANDPRMPPIVGVGWTVTYEMLFYAIFGACLTLPRKKGPILCIAIIIAMVLSGTLLLHHIHDGELRRIVAFYSYKNILFFSVGIGLALGGHSLPSLSALVALGCAMAFMAIALAAYIYFGMQDGSLMWQCISFMTCSLVITLAISSRRGDIFLGRRLLLHIGNASFSTYLFHAPIMHFLALLSARFLMNGNGDLFILVVTPICLAAGSLIYFQVERPLTRLTRDVSHKLLATKIHALAS